MKKVAISTLGEQFLLSNYGTFFQHYALRRVLCEMGFVPFRVSHVSDRYERTGFLWNWVKDIVRPVYWLLRMRPNWQTNCRRMLEKDILNMHFLVDYRKLIGRFHEVQDFANTEFGIMGGDQILGTREDRLWLSDLSRGGGGITYAASSDWASRRSDIEWQAFASKQFARFHAIGIRERAGVALCRGLVSDGKTVDHVADPVMLLSDLEYKRIASKGGGFKRPTLFCYLVNIRSVDDLRIEEYEKLAKMLGCELKMAGIQGAELVIPSKYRIRLSPVQFIRAMIDAKYFITNSYHGSVFATILKKKFLSVWQNCPSGTDQNERQKEFMSQFGLSNRWVDWRLSADQWYGTLMGQINWSEVVGGIMVFRDKSLKWLLRALKA